KLCKRLNIEIFKRNDRPVQRKIMKNGIVCDRRRNHQIQVPATPDISPPGHRFAPLLKQKKTQAAWQAAAVSPVNRSTEYDSFLLIRFDYNELYYVIRGKCQHKNF
ncbi:hypothetical protein, partial [Paenibacillus cisolokensis]|uniref:hypothetical protein n=1 Tax=Paenibacillus cisolokensis TaxID=1658519 RepID=UPI001BCDACE5